VELGTCVVDPLPDGLPQGSEIEVTIRYDEQARVHVSAKVMKNGQTAHAEIVRPENLLISAVSEETRDADVAVKARTVNPILAPAVIPPFTAPLSETERPVFVAASPETTQGTVPESSDVPIALCADCGTQLDARGRCPRCESQRPAVKPAAAIPATPRPKFRGVPSPPAEAEIIELGAPTVSRATKPQPTKATGAGPKMKPPPLPGNLAGTSRTAAEKAGEAEFWRITKKKQ
jgi:molecular chaperone DnaK